VRFLHSRPCGSARSPRSSVGAASVLAALIAPLFAPLGTFAHAVPQCPPRHAGGGEILASSFLGSSVSIGAADVDGNGRFDLFVGGNELRLYRDISQPWLEAPSWSGGAAGAALAVGDWNGDGFDDAFTGSGANPAAFQQALSDGAGGLTLSTLGPIAGLHQVTSIVTFDFNGDGFDDAAVRSASGNLAPRLFRGGPSGLVSQGALGGFNAQYSLEAADLDGDGLDDLASTTLNGFELFRSLGTGAFSSMGAFPMNGTAASLIGLVDVDGDGDVDIASVEYVTNTLRTLLNDGAGAFSPGPTSAAPAMPRSLKFADWDLDGRVDVLVGDGFGRLSWLRASVGGLFELPRELEVSDSGVDCLAHDVDADGDNELFVTLWTGSGFATSLAVLEGLGLELRSPVITRDDHAAFDLTFADLDADDEVDVLSGGGYLPPAYARGIGDGSFTHFTALSTDVQRSPVRLADLNGDGASEILFATASTLFIFRGVPGGTPVLHAATAVSPEVNDLALADFDADGLLDLATIDGGGALLVSLGDGALGFQAQWQGVAGYLPSSVAAADFDGDGRVDLATLGGGSYDLTLHLGLGDGTFQSQLSTILGQGLRRIQAADMDLDGGIDLVLHSGSPGQVQTLLNRPSGFVFAPGGATLSSGGRWRLADVDADGVLDLLSSDTVSGRIFLGMGDGGFTAPRAVTFGGFPYSLSAVDLDGDERSELVFSGATVSPNAPDHFLAVIQHASAAPARYCGAERDLSGCLPRMLRPECASLGASIPLVVANLPPVRPVLFVYGANRAALPFLGGTLCVAPPLQRTPVQLASAAATCAGQVVLDLSSYAGSGAAPSWIAGVLQCFQALYRDGAGALNWSDAVELTFVP
jgi:hypothetical protein